MAKFLQDEPYTRKYIYDMQHEMEKLYLIHNSVRGIVNNIKKDEYLFPFYDLARSSLTNIVDDNYEEPELYLLGKTLELISKHIKETTKVNSKVK